MSLEQLPAELGLEGDAVATVPDDLVSMLDEVAQTIVEALMFGVAAVNLVCPDGSLKVVSVAGDEDARRVLLGHVDTAETWERVLLQSEPWGRLGFADHLNEEADVNSLYWVPDVEAMTLRTLGTRRTRSSRR